MSVIDFLACDVSQLVADFTPKLDNDPTVEAQVPQYIFATEETTKQQYILATTDEASSQQSFPLSLEPVQDLILEKEPISASQDIKTLNETLSETQKSVLPDKKSTPESPQNTKNKKPKIKKLRNVITKKKRKKTTNNFQILDTETNSKILTRRTLRSNPPQKQNDLFQETSKAISRKKIKPVTKKQQKHFNYLHWKWNGGRKWSCEFCSSVFIKITHLIYHVNAVHQDITTFFKPKQVKVYKNLNISKSTITNST